MNKNETLYIGSHIGMGAPSFFLGSVQEALSFGENTFMFYTGAPQNSIRKPLEELRIDEGKDLINNSNINLDKVVVHAPYIINLGNPIKEDQYNRSVELLIAELVRTAAFGVKTLVLHPGSHVGAGLEVGIDAIAKGLDVALEKANNNVSIALETMAGKGSEIGSSLEEIKRIISLSKHSDKLGICLDTCHLNDAGYDIFDIDGLLNKVDGIIGIDKILCIHVNDSKNPLGAHKDRHANIGVGEIGFDTLNAYIHHPKLKDVPKILETPYINEKAPYKKEIEMFRNSIYEPDWETKL